MKYVVSWEARPSVTEEDAKRSLTVFSKWSPSHPEHFQAFLGRVLSFNCDRAPELVVHYAALLVQRSEMDCRSPAPFSSFTGVTLTFVTGEGSGAGFWTT